MRSVSQRLLICLTLLLLLFFGVMIVVLETSFRDTALRSQRALLEAQMVALIASAELDEDGFTIHPGTPRPTRFATYEDHRMAMSLSLLGLRSPGIEIGDPGCVAKTYPDFFTDLARLN